MNSISIEKHPLEPFLPINSRVLLLGSFPPPRQRWSMDFYYPNLQNDMWRIFGLIFFNDKEYFLTDDISVGTDQVGSKKKIFCKNKISDFLTERGIALSDTAYKIIRHKGNASDKFLEVVESRDISQLLSKIPLCEAIVTTGEKATSTLSLAYSSEIPSIGTYTGIKLGEREIRHYRMPSTSRAYPLPIGKKAEIYGDMFRQMNII